MQTNYSLSPKKHHIPKQCSQNIDQNLIKTCKDKHLNKYYTHEMMIHDWDYNNVLQLSGMFITEWFSYFTKNLSFDLNQLRTLQKLLQNKQQKLLANNQKIKNELISYTNIKNINMMAIEAPIRHIQFYSQLAECLLILNSKIQKFDRNPTKLCICCGLEYSQQMLLNLKYSQKISLMKLCQIMLNNTICCSFCLRRVQNMIKWTPQKHVCKIQNSQQEVQFILKYVKKQHQKWFACWYDGITQTWRYATIINVEQYKPTVITVQDEFTNESLELNLEFLIPDAYFIFCESTNAKFEINDDAFDIDQSPEHLADWLQANNIWQDKWEIPVILSDGTRTLIPFWQIRHSVSLFKCLIQHDMF